MIPIQHLINDQSNGSSRLKLDINFWLQTNYRDCDRSEMDQINVSHLKLINSGVSSPQHGIICIADVVKWRFYFSSLERET